MTFNSDIQFTVHLFIVFPFQTHIITNERNFLFLSCPFLLWPLVLWVYDATGIANTFVPFDRNLFLCRGRSRDFWRPERNLRDTWTELLKIRKTGTAPEKTGWLESLSGTRCMHVKKYTAHSY